MLLTGSVPLSSRLSEGNMHFSTLFLLSFSPVPVLSSLHLKNTIANTTRPHTIGATTSAADPKAPYALPTLTITSLFHSVYAFYAYTLWTQTGVLSFGLGTLGSGFLAAVAMWCILFASSDGRISRKTGADKRTSGYPFKNNEAEKRKGR